MPRTARPPLRTQAGQATVELVALIPFLILVALLLWQLVVAGHAAWAGGAAARAAARANAVGADPERAARALLPRRLRDGLEVETDEEGEVEVEVPVPAVLVRGRLTTVTARAQFEPQG